MRFIGRCLLAVLCILTCARAAVAADLPRYHLAVGKKLIYTTASEMKSTDGSQNDMGTEGSWQITVVRQNADGSQRVIIRSANTFTQSFGGQKHTQPERVVLAYADIFPDGRVPQNKSLGMSVDPASVLPPLPADADQLAKGWSTTNPMKQESVAYSPLPSTDADFVFKGVQDGMTSKIYLIKQNYTYHFDRARGIVTAVDGETSQDYGFHSKGTATTKLKSEETVPADQIAAMAADFDILFAAKENYDAKMRAVNESPDNADALTAEAKTLVEKARGETKSDAVRAEFDKLLADHEEYAKYVKDSAAQLAQMLNKPAADWTSTDIDGKPVKLADFRGKVVVMDFWYRGCGWCMYAMPQVNQLAQSYHDKPVAVLGMNTDNDEKDARFVIDAMGLKYSTIKAETIPPKYGVQSFPTLIVVDQQGIIRDMHLGYSPTLREDLGKKIDALLAKPTTTASGN